MLLWCKASSNLTWFLRWFRVVPELDIYHKSLFLQHFGHGSKHGSGWFHLGSGKFLTRTIRIMHCILYTFTTLWVWFRAWFKVVQDGSNLVKGIF